MISMPEEIWKENVNQAKVNAGRFWCDAGTLWAADKLVRLEEVNEQLGAALRLAYAHIIKHHACGVRQVAGQLCPVCHHADGTEPEMDAIVRALGLVPTSVDHEQELLNQGWRCSGCGSTRHSREIRQAGYISCCPERKLVPPLQSAGGRSPRHDRP